MLGSAGSKTPPNNLRAAREGFQTPGTVSRVAEAGRERGSVGFLDVGADPGLAAPSCEDGGGGLIVAAAGQNGAESAGNVHESVRERGEAGGNVQSIGFPVVRVVDEGGFSARGASGGT